MKVRAVSSVVPWRTPEQFHEVYRCLFNKSIIDKRWAVDQITVWETRCHPALPTAIEATVVLVRAMIQDVLFEVEKSLCHGSDVQMLYAMSLVRFVNLTLEVERNDVNKLSLISLAKMRNIPSWIVDMRHHATHSHCPSLPVLRLGAERAMEYLEGVFWKPEAVSLSFVVRAPSHDAPAILEVLKEYRAIQLHREVGFEDEDEKDKSFCDLTVLAKKITRFIRRSPAIFVDVLVRPDVFLSIDDLKVLLLRLGMFLDDEETYSLPPNVEKFWLLIIRLMHQQDIIPKFLEKLLISQENCYIPICQKICATWATKLLLVNSSFSPQSAMTRCFEQKGVLFNMYHLMYACLRGMNKYLLPVFDMIVSRLDDEFEFHSLYCAVAIYQKYLVITETDESIDLAISVTQRTRKAILREIVFTVDDAEEDVNERKAKKRKGNMWGLAQRAVRFAEIPVGVVINPLMEDLPSSEAEEKFIINENNSEVPMEEVAIPYINICVETEISEPYDMVYRRRLRN